MSASILRTVKKPDAEFFDNGESWENLGEILGGIRHALTVFRDRQRKTEKQILKDSLALRMPRLSRMLKKLNRFERKFPGVKNDIHKKISKSKDQYCREILIDDCPKIARMIGETIKKYPDVRRSYIATFKMIKHNRDTELKELKK